MASALGSRPRRRGRGRPSAGGRMPAGLGANKGIDPAYSGPAHNAIGNGGTPAPSGSTGHRGGKGVKGAVGEQALTGPGGRQLQARVQSGAITSQQAQRTMQQRQTLAKALGPNWRDKLTVGGESFAKVNKQLKANPGNAKLAAIRKKLLTNRAKVLDQARTKLKGGGTEGGDEKDTGGKKKRRGGEGQE